MNSPTVLGIGLSVRALDPKWRDLGRNIDLALEAGVKFVELPLHQLDIVAAGRILRDRLADVQAVIRGRNARYTLHGHLGINLMDESYRLPLHRELLDVNIAIAAEFGCTISSCTPVSRGAARQRASRMPMCGSAMRSMPRGRKRKQRA